MSRIPTNLSSQERIYYTIPEDYTYQELVDHTNRIYDHCCEKIGAINLPVGMYGVNSPNQLGSAGIDCLRANGLLGVDATSLAQNCQTRDAIAKYNAQSTAQ